MSQMNENLLNPFVLAVVKSFSTMIQVDFKPQPPLLTDILYDMNALVEFTGELQGNLLLTFPNRTASRTVGKFTGKEAVTDEGAVQDGIREFCNMVSGNAKQDLLTHNFSISIPKFISKIEYQALSHNNKNIVTIPFQSADMGIFCIKINISENISIKTNDSKVLLVDDSSTMRSLQKLALQEFGLYNIFEAENGKQGLEILAENHPIDLILLDWKMPVMNGLQLLEEVRKNDIYRNTKIVMCTSEILEENENHALQAGADRFIKKPFDPKIIADLL